MTLRWGSILVVLPPAAGCGRCDAPCHRANLFFRRSASSFLVLQKGTKNRLKGEPPVRLRAFALAHRMFPLRIPVLRGPMSRGALFSPPARKYSHSLNFSRPLPRVATSCISLHPPQATGIAHSAAAPFPTEPADAGLRRGPHYGFAPRPGALFGLPQFSVRPCQPGGRLGSRA